MQKALALVLAFSLGFVPLAIAEAGPSPLPNAAQDQSSYQPYTNDQLDNLLGPIALYPDPLLAQVLVAATFVDQIDDAARWVRSYGQNGVDDQPWDVSVRAVAHYPTVLNMMDDNLDWTTAVGQAYVYQSTDVMMSIQRLRAMAEQQGNLVSTPQQEVVNEDGGIGIWPASPEYIYVPVYNPAIVFFRPGMLAAFSFGPALAIGVWLNLDCDWGRHRVYYTGWRGGGWIGRSRPHIRVSSIYVNRRFSNVTVNRTIIQRPVNFEGLSRYQNVHRNVSFQSRSRGAPVPTRPVGGVPNKIIDRNIMPNQWLNQFRGWQQPSAAPVVRSAPQSPAARPQQQRTFPQVRQPAPAQRTMNSQPPNAFGRGSGSFNTREASQRGQQSRAQMGRRPTSRPVPTRQPASRSQGRPQHSRGR